MVLGSKGILTPTDAKDGLKYRFRNIYVIDR